MNSRLIQVIALVVGLVCTIAGGRLLVPILNQSEAASLRYTNVTVDNAPPFVALGTAIGTLRGLIVDILWIKVNLMKEKGLFYEVMADAELITKLQPRFAAVWAFHGHNMAYNISVCTNTKEERWEWVNAGIRLVRNEGLRYNPNDIVLHRELAFWFAHKIEGTSDDAHLFYKQAFCREWHFVLGTPPESYEDRVAWMKELADAPATLQRAEAQTPGVAALIARLDEKLLPFGEEQRFRPSRQFLSNYGWWKAAKEESETARLFDAHQVLRDKSAVFTTFDEIASDPDDQVQRAWHTLVLFVRKRVLLDEYNMDPQLMYEFTRDIGPLDWRHGQSHALYWARRGSQFAESRIVDPDDAPKILNNDRLQLQALQSLARWGRITFDPFSNELPSRMPDPRWVDVIEVQFTNFYTKHYETRGGGGESFINFLKNFMAQAIRQAWRSGEQDRAERLLARLDERFGRGAVPPNPYYDVPVDVFVKREIQGEYEFQPFIAPNEAAASLRYGFRVGIGQDRPEIYKNALAFVQDVIAYFKGNKYNDYVNKFGEGRIRALIGDLEDVKPIAFLQVMTDPTISLVEKKTIWDKVDKQEPMLRAEVYDRMTPVVRQQLASSDLGRKFTYDELFSAPPNLEIYRAMMARQREAEAQRQADYADEAARHGEGR